MKHITVSSTTYVAYAASAPRIFFYRINNRIAYAIIVLVAYYVTAHILLAAEGLRFLSETSL